MSKRKAQCWEQDRYFTTSTPICLLRSQQAALFHTTEGDRECQWDCWRAPSPLARRRWAEVAIRFCGGERTAEVLPCPLMEKNEGEGDTKNFPLPPRFSLAVKAASTGASLCPCSHHLPVPCHPDRDCFGEGRVSHHGADLSSPWVCGEETNREASTGSKA